jgi:hypothetical protein
MSKIGLERGSWIAGIVSAVVAVIALFISALPSTQPKSSAPLDSVQSTNASRKMVVGLWKVNVEGGKANDALYWRLYPDGSISKRMGTWFINGNLFQLTYSNGVAWRGTIKGNIVTGTIDYGSNKSGSFVALKVDANPDQPYVSYAACFGEGKPTVSCLDRETNECRTFTGRSFALLEECNLHCNEEAARRGVTCTR